MPKAAEHTLAGAGIHQDGVPETEQIHELIPFDVVSVWEPQLALDEDSGRKAAFAARLAGLGCSLGDAALGRVFHRFTALADRNRIVSDADLVALAIDDVRRSVAAGEAETASGEATVESQSDREALGRDRPFGYTRQRAFGPNTDVIEANAPACGSAINGRMAAAEKRRSTGEPTALNRDILINGVNAGAPPEGAALWDTRRKRVD